MGHRGMNKRTLAKHDKRTAADDVIAVLEKPQLKSSATRQTPKAATAIEQGLLEQIAAKPQDDGLRLVYADFLTEQGSRWGEVIIAQVAVPPDDADDYGDKLEVSMKLEKKHAKAWLEPIRPFLTRWSFERGLLSVVATEPDKFLQAADAIALRAPRATLELSGVKPKHVVALAAAPLGRFAEVSLSEQRLDDTQLATLMASPAIAGVERWLLDFNQLGDDGVAALASSAHVASVQSLSLRTNISKGGTVPRPALITTTGLHALLTSKKLPGLRRLTVEGTAVNASSVRESTLELEALDLHLDSGFDEELLSALADAASLKNLKELRVMAQGPVTATDLDRLVNARPLLRSLQVIHQTKDIVPEAVKERLRARRA